MELDIRPFFGFFLHEDRKAQGELAMFISLQELEVRKVEFSQQLAPGTIDLGGELRQSGRLSTKGRAELLKEHRGGKNTVEDIRVLGDFSTEIEARCARCVEPVPTRIGGDFDLLYRPLGVDAGRGSVTGRDGRPVPLLQQGGEPIRELTPPGPRSPPARPRPGVW